MVRMTREARGICIGIFESVKTNTTQFWKSPDSCWTNGSSTIFRRTLWIHVSDCWKELVIITSTKMTKKMEVTCTKLLHDCLVEQHRILTWLVNLLVLKPFNEKFGAVVDELCGPLEELIPEPVKEFLSPSDVIKEMASNAMSAAIQAAITAGDQSSIPEKMVGYFKEQGVTVDSTNLASLQKEAQTATVEEGKLAPPEPERQRAPTKVFVEPVESDSEPDTKSPTAAGTEHTAVTASA